MTRLFSNDQIDPEEVNSAAPAIKLNHPNKKRHAGFHQLILIKTITANYLPISYLRMQLVKLPTPTK